MEVSRYENGKEVNVDPLGETDYFGELALLRNEPRAATVKAKTVTTCVWLDRKSVLMFASCSPCHWGSITCIVLRLT